HRYPHSFPTRRSSDLDLLAPDLAHLLLGDRPRQLGAIEAKLLVDREIRLRLEQLERIAHALSGALPEKVEDLEDRLELAGLHAIVELVAVAAEARDVAREEIHPAAVEGVEVAVEDRGGVVVVEVGTREVKFFDELGDAST